MICALLRLGSPPGSKMAATFFDVFSHMPDGLAKEDVRNLMAGVPPQPQVAGHLLRNKMAEFGKGQDANRILQNIAFLNDRHQSFYDMRLTELANPAIPSKSLRMLFAQDSTTNSAKAAMFANPNFPSDVEWTLSKTDPKQLEIYALATARYGSLSGLKAVNEYGVAMLGDDPWAWEGAAEARTYLCARKDLPKGWAAELEHIVDEPDFKMLAQTAGHRELVREQIKNGQPFMFFVTKNRLRLSPEMPSDMLEQFYEKLQTSEGQSDVHDWAGAMAEIAAHPNAPRVLAASAAFKDDELVEPLAAAFAATNSPHKEGVLMELLHLPMPMAQHDSIASVQDCSPDSLKWAFDDAIRYANGGTDGNGMVPFAPRWNDVCLTLASHPNFPWKEYSLEQMLSAAGEKNWGAMGCLMNLAARYPEADNMGPGEYTISSLFSPKLSTRRLEKIAEQYPDLESLVGMHPNGEGIGSSSETVASFTRKFATPELPGRGSGDELPPRQPPLEI